MNFKYHINGNTTLYGCIASPTRHVRAPSLFNSFFIENNINSVMVPIEVDQDDLENVIKGLKSIKNFRGLAVTIPHKLTLANHCDFLGDGAQATGAVNIVKFDKNGKIHGENFDGEGFVQGLIGEGYMLENKKILLLGAGGAARGIAVSLSKKNIHSLDVKNRSKINVLKLIDIYKKFSKKNNIFIQESINIDFTKYDIVINSTSLGLSENDALPIDPQKLKNNCLICEIIMKPEKTKLVKKSLNCNLDVHLGKHMLDYQFKLMKEFFLN